MHLHGSRRTGAPVLKPIASCADGADQLLAVHCMVDDCTLNDCMLLVKSNVQAQLACPRLARLLYQHMCSHKHIRVTTVVHSRVPAVLLYSVTYWEMGS